MGSQVVRSVLWPDTGSSSCITGGEDSVVCLWDATGAAVPAARAAVPRAKKHHGLGKRPRGILT